MEITLTTTEEQKNLIDYNLTAIDFTECEKLLRLNYNISDDEKLYIRKIDIYQEGMKIPKIEYDIYSKLNDTNLIKLNLSVCKNVNIDLSLPVFISEIENIDEYNKSSGYYNDICYPAQSESNTDIIIKDRQKEFIDKNKTVCQENCEFTEYNYNTQKAKCSCKVEESSSSSIFMNINKTEIYESFKDIKSKMNIEILRCYKVLFTKDGIIKNIAFYLIITIFLLHLIFIILFYSKDLNKIKKIIENIVFAIYNWDLVKAEEKKNSKAKKDNKKKENNLLKNIKKKRKTLTKINTDFNINEDENNNEIIKKKSNKNKKRNSTSNYINRKKNKKNSFSNNSAINKLTKSVINEKAIIEKIKKIMEYNKQEINELSYEKAIKYDNRTYCEYYISLIQTKHILIFSFYYNEDYNSRIIKIDLFFNSFVIYFTINALFFNDGTIHQIYEDNGKYQILEQLPQIIYSTLISSVLNILLNILSLSEDSIIELKNNKNKNDIDNRKTNLNNKLSIKFILYFIISSIYLLLFWYYLSLFCAIYINTQFHLTKDTLLSFVLSFIYPFFLYLLPGIIRIPSLKNKKEKKTCLYNASKLLQKIL